MASPRTGPNPTALRATFVDGPLHLRTRMLPHGARFVVLRNPAAADIVNPPLIEGWYEREPGEPAAFTWRGWWDGDWPFDIPSAHRPAAPPPPPIPVQELSAA